MRRRAPGAGAPSGRPYQRQVLTVAAGAGAGQAAVLAATPVLSRLYEPEDFGVLAVYVSIVTLLTSIASGRYEVAIPLPEAQEDAANLAGLAAALALASSAVALLVVAVFRTEIADLLNAPDLAWWLWLAPLNILVLALYEAQKYWSTRHARFALLSMSNVARSAVGVVVQLLTGAIRGVGSVGLLFGQFAGSIMGTAVMASELRRSEFRHVRGAVGRAGMRRMASEYRKLPRHALSTSFLNTLSVASLPLVLAGFLDPLDAGLVMLTQRIVVLPTQLFGQAIWQVTHARLGAMPQGERRDFLRAVNRHASFLYAYPLVGIAVFSYFAADVFGEEWSRLEQILPSIAAMVLFSAVSNATSYFAAMHRFREESISNIVLIAVRLLALAVCAPRYDVVAVVLVYAGSSSLVYLGINMFWARQLESTNHFVRSIVTAVAISGAAALAVRAALGHSLLASITGVTVIGFAYYGVLLRRIRHDTALAVGVEAPKP